MPGGKLLSHRYESHEMVYASRKGFHPEVAVSQGVEVEKNAGKAGYGAQAVDLNTRLGIDPERRSLHTTDLTNGLLRIALMKRDAIEANRPLDPESLHIQAEIAATKAAYKGPEHSDIRNTMDRVAREIVYYDVPAEKRPKDVQSVNDGAFFVRLAGNTLERVKERTHLQKLYQGQN